jgi:hypothetical protein
MIELKLFGFACLLEMKITSIRIVRKVHCEFWENSNTMQILQMQMSAIFWTDKKGL